MGEQRRALQAARTADRAKARAEASRAQQIQGSAERLRADRSVEFERVARSFLEAAKARGYPGARQVRLYGAKRPRWTRTKRAAWKLWHDPPPSSDIQSWGGEHGTTWYLLADGRLACGGDPDALSVVNPRSGWLRGSSSEGLERAIKEVKRLPLT
jgi:hypothetical protein